MPKLLRWCWENEEAYRSQVGALIDASDGVEMVLDCDYAATARFSPRLSNCLSRLPEPLRVGHSSLRAGATAALIELRHAFHGVDFENSVLLNQQRLRIDTSPGVMVCPVNVGWMKNMLVLATETELPLDEIYFVEVLLLRVELFHRFGAEE